ncbi:uncharacterized protein B0I36DRAFT_396313, partial [Microdochium trichocladiopsis]
PHLGASTVEAQENVSLDVCSQILTILLGGLPPPPSTRLDPPGGVPQAAALCQARRAHGCLYTQHYASAGRNSGGGGGGGGLLGGTKFELVYEGELSGVSNTRPLFAALVKGLVSVITDLGGRDVNIVNATLIAKEKGIVINEVHERGGSGDRTSSGAYASLVTLRRGANRSGGQMIQGYVSGKNIYISKLGRFMSSFVPESSLLILHNYDEPGKIGGVGLVLGKHGINIRSMQVTSLEEEESEPEGKEMDSAALMILGVSGTVSRAVVEDLERSEGILDVSLVQL